MQYLPAIYSPESHVTGVQLSVHLLPGYIHHDRWQLLARSRSFLWRCALWSSPSNEWSQLLGSKRWRPRNVIYLLRKITYNITASHYDDVLMSAMAHQITSLTIVYSTVCSGADQSKHQSSASLAFVWGICRGPVNSPHKWPVTRKCFHLMTSSCNFDNDIYPIILFVGKYIMCVLGKWRNQTPVSENLPRS